MKVVEFLLVKTLCFLYGSKLVTSSRDRTCCRYSCQQPPSSCPYYCQGSPFSCVLASHTGQLLSTDLQHCSVTQDSKFDKVTNYRQDCLSSQYESEEHLSDQVPPILLLAYPFQGGSSSQFSGFDLRVRLDSRFNKLRFRLKNKNEKICPTHEGHDEVLQEGSLCNPRCVEIERQNHSTISSPSSDPLTPEFLSYDCEAGFYRSGNILVSTAEHDYELSICLGFPSGAEACGHFLFLLPDPDTLDTQGVRLVLADMKQFEEYEHIILFIPCGPGVVLLKLEVIAVAENSSFEVVHQEKFKLAKDDIKEGLVRVEVGQARNGWGNRLQVRVTAVGTGGEEFGGAMLSAVLVRPEQGHHTLVLLIVILLAVVMVSLVLVLYKKCQKFVEAGSLEPVALVQTGQMEERAVLIVTPLDHPGHVEVVRDLCKYLREWCGLGPTYFALDDETGIGSGQMDPWKWCQETGEKVRENGTIVFIAGPDVSLVPNSVSIHPNLEQNQAFLTTRHLRTMAGEGRALVARFPYSNIKNLPPEVPDHLQAAAFLLPVQMNEFLIQLLQVKKRALCSLLPWPLVRPDVKPGDLSRPGGPELVQRIRQLTFEAPEERVVGGKGGNRVRGRDEAVIEQGEEDVLVNRTVGGESRGKILQIGLEAGIPSTKDMFNRDRFDVED